MSAGVRAELIDSLIFGAGGKSPVDIDPSLLVLLAIFFFLMWYLKRTVFEPYLALTDARYERIGGASEAGKEMKVEADRILEEYQDKMTATRQEAAAVRVQIRQDAKDKEQEMLAQTRTDVEKILNEATADLEAELGKAQAEFAKEAKALSELISERVLST